METKRTIQIAIDRFTNVNAGGFGGYEADETRPLLSIYREYQPGFIPYQT